MREFHPTEVVNPVSMVPGYDAKLLRRSAIKLSTGPKIMVVLPIGTKALSTVLECPQCVERGESKTRFSVPSGFQPDGMISVNFMLSQMNWTPPLNVTMGYMVKNGMLSAEARNVMTLECLANHPTVEYIFYVDDDMIIPSLGLYTLYNWMERHPDWGAVTGVYTTRVSPPEPLIYTKHGAGAAWDFEMGPGANPEQIMGAGAGCLLARVSAIRDWMSHNPGYAVWADSTESPNGGKVTWGHDVRFVRNLTEAGWPCYVVGEVLCQHFDRTTGQIYSVPPDAPGFKKRNVNTAHYWDGVYGAEGFSSWRTYEKMHNYILDILNTFATDSVLELGCGPGILGQKITATRPCSWIGMDLSEVAVAQCKARYLKAFVGDVRDITPEDIDNGVHRSGALIATELLEHLDWNATKKLLNMLNHCGPAHLIFATPWKCMSPSEVPEHMVFVDDAWLEAVEKLLDCYDLDESTAVDDHHRVHVWTRLDAPKALME